MMSRGWCPFKVSRAFPSSVLTQVHVSDQLLFQLGPVLHTNLGVVLRNELLLMLEFDPGFLTQENTH